ncbi:hypothetical protein [Acidilobus sp.]|uniref:hypothetical protein n=1 Tax=Acidilobus sp. TaxID=1872109 RepID=UPI003D072036
MRIVHMVHSYWPIVGGVEKVMRRVAEGIAPRGHKIHVVTYNRLRPEGVSPLLREETIKGSRNKARALAQLET